MSVFPANDNNGKMQQKDEQSSYGDKENNPDPAIERPKMNKQINNNNNNNNKNNNGNNSNGDNNI